MPHHPIFERFHPFEGFVPAGFSVDSWGVLVDQRFFGPCAPALDCDRVVKTSIPEFSGPSYFDLIALFEAIERAKQRFVMIELGAGYGYWLSQAAAAARQKALDCFLVGVEAEPDHFKMMIRHLCNNAIEPERHRLLHAAIAATDGEAIFACGRPNSWWGQRILLSPDEPTGISDSTALPVSAISLSTLLKDLPRVNVLHMDIQGSELEVINASLNELNEKVETIIIGTHSREIERGLRKAFRTLRWCPVYDFEINKISQTEFGAVQFDDGLQVWRSPNA